MNARIDMPQPDGAPIQSLIPNPLANGSELAMAEMPVAVSDETPLPRPFDLRLNAFVRGVTFASVALAAAPPFLA